MYKYKFQKYQTESPIFAFHPFSRQIFIIWHVAANLCKKSGGEFDRQSFLFYCPSSAAFLLLTILAAGASKNFMQFHL
jgi:hypothetical protein